MQSDLDVKKTFTVKICARKVQSVFFSFGNFKNGIMDICSGLILEIIITL